MGQVLSLKSSANKEEEKVKLAIVMCLNPTPEKGVGKACLLSIFAFMSVLFHLSLSLTLAVTY